MISIEFIFLASFRIQQLSINTQELSDTHRCNLHIISISLLMLVCRVTGVNSLNEYSDKLVTDRVHEAAYLLPPLLESNGKHNLNVPQVMLDKVSRFLSRFYLFSIYEVHKLEILIKFQSISI